MTGDSLPPKAFSSIFVQLWLGHNYSIFISMTPTTVNTNQYVLRPSEGGGWPRNKVKCWADHQRTTSPMQDDNLPPHSRWSRSTLRKTTLYQSRLEVSVLKEDSPLGQSHCCLSTAPAGLTTCLAWGPSEAAPLVFLPMLPVPLPDLATYRRFRLLCFWKRKNQTHKRRHRGNI